MEQANYTEVANYYNELWDSLEKQNKAGVNSRHREILLRMIDAGLKNDSSVLEIGCGIGILSNLIAGKLGRGTITGVDISPQSIDFASKKYAEKKNMEFLVSDMTDFNKEGTFDIILFPDVLEHIPTDAHANIFQTIVKNCHDQSIILINLPNPRMIRYLRVHNPSSLQIIDQDIETEHLINLLAVHNFFLESKETYALYMDRPDYEWMVFRKNTDFDSVEDKSKVNVILNGILQRIRLIFA